MNWQTGQSILLGKMYVDFTWTRAEMGPDDGKAMIDQLQEEIDRFNKQYSQFVGKAEMQPFQAATYPKK